MAILDTSVVIERFKGNKEIKENVTVVTLIEFPRISGYKLFKGSVYFPTIDEYSLAFELQKKLYKRGKPKTFSDLVIASISINRAEELITKDNDFRNIAEVSNLKLKVLEDG
jgi:predicted nucleic acid-binding protein